MIKTKTKAKTKTKLVKPRPKHPLSPRLDYNDVMTYIDEKYKIDHRDYARKYKRGWEKHPEDEELPYQDFWHWTMAHNYDDVHNGSTIYVSLEHRIGEENPLWVQEILELLRKEFGKYADGDELRFWVSW